MATVMYFGMSLGLAGVAGIRTYLPLMIIGLLTRYSADLILAPPFKILASAPALFLLAVLAWYELLMVHYDNSSPLQNVPVMGFRCIGGAVLFAGVFPGLGVLFGLILGGGLAALSTLVVQKMRREYGATGNGSYLMILIEETAAVVGILLAILIPWIWYFIWATLLFVFISGKRNVTQRKTYVKTRSWR